MTKKTTDTPDETTPRRGGVSGHQAYPVPRAAAPCPTAERLRQRIPRVGHADLMQLLLIRTGMDFRDYADRIVARGVAARMAAHGLRSTRDYLALCRLSAGEVEALRRMMLVSVTGFFRDRAAFRCLADAVRRRLRHRAGGDPLRVWVAGCATGQEAYSVAVVLAEALGGPDAAHRSGLRILATDLDDRALETAREGAYPITALGQIPEGLIDPYFASKAGGVRVRPALRRLVSFARHDLVRDRPLADLDLVTLRNVMIYFNPALRDRTVRGIGSALTPGGLLMLGACEALGPADRAFRPVARGAGLYRHIVPKD